GYQFGLRSSGLGFGMARTNFRAALAKRRKKRKTYRFYASCASFRGYSLFPLRGLGGGLISKHG
ncbi:MAG: hypothetical protein WCQ21_10655, partial [Verrucomicrobiota bacterium]